MALKNKSQFHWILAILFLVILLFAIEGLLTHFNIHQQVKHLPYPRECED